MRLGNVVKVVNKTYAVREPRIRYPHQSFNPMKIALAIFKAFLRTEREKERVR